LKSEKLKSQLKEFCFSVRLAPLSSTTRQHAVFTAFLIRYVGIQGADAIELLQPYLQARFEHRLKLMLISLPLEDVFTLIAAMVTKGAVLSSSAYPLPRPLALVPINLRLTALIFVLCLPCIGSVKIVTQKGGDISQAGQRQLLCWAQCAKEGFFKRCLVEM
jgi:hypothetical protein